MQDCTDRQSDGPVNYRAASLIALPAVSAHVERGRFLRASCCLREPHNPYSAPVSSRVSCGGSCDRCAEHSPRAQLHKTLVIQDNDEPLAPLLTYEHFLAMQEKMDDEE